MREVSATERGVIPLQTRLRYTTMVVLPDGEEILDVLCGDRDFWVISATHNIAHVKPAKAGAETNLNLVTSSGTIYSFMLTEKSSPPDLKVYVQGEPGAASGKPKYYSAAQVEALESQIAELRAVCPRRGAEAGRSRRSLSTAVSDAASVSLRRAQVREALLRSVDVARRPVHVREVGRHRTARALRAEGRQAVDRQLPGSRGHVRRAEGPRSWLSGAWLAAFHVRAAGAMTMPEEPGTPGTAPVSDHRPVPRGVLPRGFQTWLMAGLALGIVLIILITGQPEPSRNPAQTQPAPAAPNPDRLRDYQERLRAMEARQALEAQAPRSQQFLRRRVSRSPPAPRLRIRSRPIASVESTRVCSRATLSSVDGRRESARKRVNAVGARRG